MPAKAANRVRRDRIEEDFMIDIADLRLTLASDAGPVNILNGLNLKVTARESLGIVGPSGSGKTSLMLLVAGLEQASGGRIKLGEAPGIVDVTAMTEDQL